MSYVEGMKVSLDFNAEEAQEELRKFSDKLDRKRRAKKVIWGTLGLTVTAGIAYLVKLRKQESINLRSAMDTIYQPNLSVPSRIPLHTSSILKQEAESERIRNKILSGRYDI